jgi:hypothetical protein
VRVGSAPVRVGSAQLPTFLGYRPSTPFSLRSCVARPYVDDSIHIALPASVIRKPSITK